MTITLPKRGRPSGDRLAPPDALRLKDVLIEEYKSLAQFYEAAFVEAKLPVYTGFKQPSDLATVSRAFAAALSCHRPLPKLYWNVLKGLLGIASEDFLPRAGTLTPPIAPAKLTVAPLESTTAAPAVGPIPLPAAQTPITTPQTGKRTPSSGANEAPKASRHKKAKDRQSKVSLRGDKSLADWFRGLSLQRIKMHLFANLFSTSKDALDEGLDGETHLVIAEKLADADYVEFFWFYCDDFLEVPDRLRAVVSTLIAVDEDLAEKVLRNMEKHYDYLEALDGWIRDIDKFYPPHILNRISSRMANLVRTPEFRKYNDCVDLERVTRLITWFLQRANSDAAQILIKVSLSNDLASLKHCRTDPKPLQVFWHKTKTWMTEEQKQRVQKFLEQNGLLGPAPKSA